MSWWLALAVALAAGGDEVVARVEDVHDQRALDAAAVHVESEVAEGDRVGRGRRGRRDEQDGECRHAKHRA